MLAFASVVLVPVAAIAAATRYAARRRERAEAQQAEKMEAVVRLAGGVAHDFNNMMGIILGYTELLLQQVQPGDPFYEAISEIQRAGERSAELTRNLLALSRQDASQTRIVDLATTVRTAMPNVRVVLGAAVHVSVETSDDALCSVEIEPAHVKEILLQLATNARDAMPGGGTFGLAVRPVVFSTFEAVRYSGVHPGRYVMLKVKDSGAGMDADVLARIFDPFFTTKEQGGGVGMGMSVVYGLVRKVGGHISVKSAPGRGSTVRILFPVTDAPASKAASAPPSFTVGQSDRETAAHEPAVPETAVREKAGDSAHAE